MPGGSELIQAGLGLAEGIVGLIKGNSAKKKAEELMKHRPEYSITPESSDELSLAESEAAKGMSARGQSTYGDLQGSDFAGSLDAILKSGGSANNIGTLYGANETGRQKLQLIQDQIRMQQLNNLVLARRNMTEQKDKSFLYNEVQPYQDKLAATGVARAGSDRMAWEGLGTLGQAGMSYLQNKNEQDMWDKYLNPTSSSDYGLSPIPQYNPIGISSTETRTPNPVTIP